MAEEYIECQNDHTKLVGDYCHTCGQRADEPRRAVIGLVQDVFVDTLAIDGKLARSIFLLLWRPGVLARRYLEGRRVHYSPPFRLFLFTSVFFFLSLFLVADFDPPKSAEDDSATELALQSAGLDSETIKVTERKWDASTYDGPAWLEPHAEQLFLAAQRVTKDPRLFVASIRKNLPRTLLLAPVLYAVILLLLYFYRRKFYVYDHFVVSLYMHAALYAYLLLAIFLNFLPGAFAWLSAVPLVWGAFQPLAALRQVYGSRWISAIPKSIIIMLIYLTGLMLIITLGLTYSLYQS